MVVVKHSTNGAALWDDKEVPILQALAALEPLVEDCRSGIKLEGQSPQAQYPSGRHGFPDRPGQFR